LSIHPANQNLKEAKVSRISMHTTLEVELEVALKIKARARERGVSVDTYLLELIEQKTPESKTINRLNSQERVRLLREWASGHSAKAGRLSADAINRESIYSGRN
jgi:hypothetical protein